MGIGYPSGKGYPIPFKWDGAYIYFVVSANIPTMCHSHLFSVLHEIAAWKWYIDNGTEGNIGQLDLPTLRVATLAFKIRTLKYLHKFWKKNENSI